LINTGAARDKDGRLYDSRSGLGGYYRYAPRNLTELYHDRFSENPGDQVNIRLPKIHESVFRRIQNNAHPCAPLGIPAGYEVVTDTGQILPASANPYETPLLSEARAKAQENVWNTVWKRLETLSVPKIDCRSRAAVAIDLTLDAAKLASPSIGSLFNVNAGG
jgi:hypothetical protein